MSLEEQWVATEDRLLHETESLGGLLGQLRDRVSSGLIGDEEWGKILERARGLPVTMGAFPFGFELLMHESRPGADFGASLVGGSQSAAFFEKRSKTKDADPATAGVAWLLKETEPESAPLRRIAGRKMLLEYDVDQIPSGEFPDPGIFLYPADQVLAGDGSDQRLHELRIVADAVASATNRRLNEAEHRQIDQVFLAMNPNTSVRAVGAFPSRAREIRLTATGFRKADEVGEFLKRTNWPGQHSAVTSTVSHLEEREAFAYVGIHYDVAENGVGPTLGLSFFAKEGQWLKDVRHWTPLIDSIREEQLAVPEKLSELVAWSSGSEPLSGKSGSFVLVRGIHHIKFTLVDDRVEQVKAYIFLLLLAWPLTG
ncbi:MAG: hypothetical protein OXN23_05625 [Gammaproteobacteria bacterium]|nr:hypothetical protein [Gammaproteobacteria bacterium]MDE0302502.1 hypothetical protein [Gammaproteobacteria bacterium]MDE0612698.1 hypothetical protein [Gammaproteobacteria bacterium]